MLRLIFALLVFATPLSAKESMRQFGSETSTGYGEIIGSLQQRLPDTVMVQDFGDSAAVSYAGNMVPPALGSFLKTAFEALDPSVIAPGKTVSLTMTLMPSDEGTSLGLMVMGRFDIAQGALPKGASVIMDGRGAGGCDGQVVLHHQEQIDDAAETYVAHLEAQGFAFNDNLTQGVSFFVGYRPGCETALYLQEEQGASLVVIRYLKD